VGFAFFWAAVLAEGWRYDEAMELCNRLEEHLNQAMTEDQRAFLCVRKGELFHLMTKIKEAEACYRQFSDDKGKYVKSRWGAEACLLLGSLLSGCGHSAEGEKYLKLSFTRYPGCKWADWAMYQWALMKSRDETVPRREALGYLEAALAQYPNSEYTYIGIRVAKRLRREIEKQ
jgi:tetratricopeptide (TPR) repeat protein